MPFYIHNWLEVTSCKIQVILLSHISAFYHLYFNLVTCPNRVDVFAFVCGILKVSAFILFVSTFRMYGALFPMLSLLVPIQSILIYNNPIYYGGITT